MIKEHLLPIWLAGAVIALGLISCAEAVKPGGVNTDDKVKLDVAKGAAIFELRDAPGSHLDVVTGGPLAHFAAALFSTP